VLYLAIFQFTSTSRKNDYCDCHSLLSKSTEQVQLVQNSLAVVFHQSFKLLLCFSVRLTVNVNTVVGLILLLSLCLTSSYSVRCHHQTLNLVVFDKAPHGGSVKLPFKSFNQFHFISANLLVAECVWVRLSLPRDLRL